MESRVRLAPVIIFRETIAADVPDAPNATQPEPFTVGMFFIRPAMGNWQAASWVGAGMESISSYREAGWTDI
jgi:hypothetical protein